MSESEFEELQQKQEQKGRTLDVIKYKYLPYKFLEVIGEGQYGKVYKATDIKTGETVAIKMIQIHGNMDQQVKDYDSFYKETNILMNLSQEECRAFIPCVYSRFISDRGNEKFFTVVMKYIDGDNFKKYILIYKNININKVIPPTLIVNFMWWIFKAICFLHKHDVVHRDIKPSNIILERSTNQLVLVDFGLSCNVLKGTKNPCDKHLVGSPLYISPELLNNWKNMTRKMLETSDVWAAGIILHELADPEHHVPFKSKSILTLYKEIRSGKIQHLQQSNKFRDINDRILTNDYKKRPDACTIYSFFDKSKRS